MPRVVTLDEYRTMPRPDVSWLLPGLLAKPASLLLIGSPKAGKSTLALQLGLALAQGKAFLGSQAQKCSVLYFQQDESEASWRFSKLNVLHNHGVDLSGPLYMVHPEDSRRGINVLDPLGREYMAATVAAVNPQVVIVDTVREVFAGDENDSATMRGVIASLSSAVMGPLRVLVLVHHIHKLNPLVPTPRPCDAARGSSYLAGAVDAIWMLHQSQLIIQSRYGDTTMALKRSASGLFTR